MKGKKNDEIFIDDNYVLMVKSIIYMCRFIESLTQLY